MKILHLDSLGDLNVLLANNCIPANGKNMAVDQLYPTAASSRWPHENIWGVYLAKPTHAWMAVWMAVTSRQCLRKRQLGYIRPEPKRGDHVGRVVVYNPQHEMIPDLLAGEPHLYLFDPEPLSHLPRAQLVWPDPQLRGSTLQLLGFRWQEIHRRGRTYRALVHPHIRPMVVDLDEWQIAVAGEMVLIPTVDIVLSPKLVLELSQRIISSDREIGADYILNEVPPLTS